MRASQILKQLPDAKSPLKTIRMMVNPQAYYMHAGLHQLFNQESPTLFPRHAWYVVRSVRKF